MIFILDSKVPRFQDSVVPSEVDLEILAIPSNKVYGLYSCPVHLLKSGRHILSPLLAAMMNKSISTGIYPHLLKHAKVIPIYKSGDETDPCNYRPISLLSVFNRLFEKLMAKRLKSHCEKNGIFFTSQYGFRDKCSTQHAILDNRIIVASSSRRGDGQRISVGGLLSGSKARFLSGNLCCSWNRCNWWPLDLIFDVSFSSPS